ncbi:MAG: PD-(D/E)XK nuclease domain-containing protein [Phaeodactylibacter sp.]|nr:PD-(D/E)XK nuclease domain-containing protein [Sinomicrobium sp.]MCB0580038.1 PD-(D/E)XK nuclease domain-containing protein [Phaeodactylibacter sp.]MCB9293347.1 PD-(D/E)XK nuclease domain-containing protein [Lewinellaceae bacterium]
MHIPKEAYYHSLVYLMLRLVGMQLLLEKETDKGRIDAVLELPDKVYIIEFKFAAGTEK